MTGRMLMIALCAVVWSASARAETVVDPSAPALDSLTAPVADVPVGTVVAQLGDSLFAPSSHKARIIRDDYGMPHIYGQTDLDVAFGFGFAQAEDHLLPMLMNFRQARGQLAEIKGKAYVEADFRAQLWRIYSLAAERYGDISKPTRDYIESFTAGINHYIAVHRQVLPVWVTDVTPTDVVALSRWITFLFSEQTGLPELQQKDIAPTVPPLPGSNQWAVGPSRSNTGAPLFVMALQLPWSGPFQMCEAHLVSREGMDVSGATFYGLPVIWAGHNRQIAWSMTPNAIDAFDLYEERLDPANPRRYFYGEEKRRMSSRRVKIRVRGDPGQGVYEVERELLYTSHGPVYKTIDNWAYAAKCSMADQTGAIGQLLAMNKAGGMDDFRTALSHLELPVFNVMYADVEGNLYYVFNGRCPMRSTDYNWHAAVPGWAAETEWQGTHTFSQLPQVLNPASGFMQNCSIAPDLVTVESGLSADAFPPYLGWGGFNNRGQRALNWLQTHQNITEDDMQKLARDTYLIDAEELKGVILSAYNRTWSTVYDPDGQVGMAIRLLRDWNDRADISSRAMLLFSLWKQRFDPMLDQLPEASRRDVRAREKLALEALRATVEYMLATYGRLDVPWGDVHMLKRGSETLPLSGSGPATMALNQTWTTRNDKGVLAVTGGSAYVMVVSLKAPVQAWSMLAFGDSDHPDSPHFADQAALQSRDAFRRDIADEQALQQAVTAVTTVPFDDAEFERQVQKALWQARVKALSQTQVEPQTSDP